MDIFEDYSNGSQLQQFCFCKYEWIKRNAVVCANILTIF